MHIFKIGIRLQILSKMLWWMVLSQQYAFKKIREKKSKIVLHWKILNNCIIISCCLQSYPVIEGMEKKNPFRWSTNKIVTLVCGSNTRSHAYCCRWNFLVVSKAASSQRFQLSGSRKIFVVKKKFKLDLVVVKKQCWDWPLFTLLDNLLTIWLI